MPTEEVSMHCPECKRKTLARRQGVNHLAHAIITLFLCGLWIPVWMIAASQENPYRCTFCGTMLKEPKIEKPAEPVPTGFKVLTGIAGAGVVLLLWMAFRR